MFEFIKKNIFIVTENGYFVILDKTNGEIISSRGFGFHTYDNNSPPIEATSMYDVASSGIDRKG